METNRPFNSVQHPATKRWAVFEDDGRSAWLYITEPDRARPVADCFVYNCQPPADELPPTWDRASPPPITTVYASPSAFHPNVSPDQVRVGWNTKGDAAVVMIDGKAVALLVAGESRGYSKAITVDGPYGHPWDERRFVEQFAEHL
jgi:hypothetical protein